MDIAETLRCAKLLIDNKNFDGAKALLDSVPEESRNNDWYYFFGMVSANSVPASQTASESPTTINAAIKLRFNREKKPEKLKKPRKISVKKSKAKDIITYKEYFDIYVKKASEKYYIALLIIFSVIAIFIGLVSPKLLIGQLIIVALNVATIIGLVLLRHWSVPLVRMLFSLIIFSQGSPFIICDSFWLFIYLRDARKRYKEYVNNKLQGIEPEQVNDAQTIEQEKSFYELLDGVDRPPKPLEKKIKEYEKRFPRKKDRFKDEEAKFLNNISTRIAKAFSKASNTVAIDSKKMKLESFMFVCAIKTSCIYTKSSDQDMIKNFIARVRDILYDQKEIGKITNQELNWLNSRLNEYLYLILEDSFSDCLGQHSLVLMDALNIIEKYKSNPSGRCSLFFLDCVCLEILDGGYVDLPLLKTIRIHDIVEIFEISPLVCSLLDEIEETKEKINMEILL